MIFAEAHRREVGFHRGRRRELLRVPKPKLAVGGGAPAAHFALIREVAGMRFARNEGSRKRELCRVGAVRGRSISELAALVATPAKVVIAPVADTGVARANAKSTDVALAGAVRRVASFVRAAGAALRTSHAAGIDARRVHAGGSVEAPGAAFTEPTATVASRAFARRSRERDIATAGGPRARLFALRVREHDARVDARPFVARARVASVALACRRETKVHPPPTLLVRPDCGLAVEYAFVFCLQGPDDSPRSTSDVAIRDQRNSNALRVDKVRFGQRQDALEDGFVGRIKDHDPKVVNADERVLVRLKKDVHLRSDRASPRTCAEKPERSPRPNSVANQPLHSPHPNDLIAEDAIV